MRNVKSSGDCTCMVCPGNFFAWGMRYVRRPFEKIICKLEAFRDAEVVRSVKHHRDCTRRVRSMNPFEISGQAMRLFIIVMH